MAGWARAIGTGWVVLDEVPGPNVDEFAEPARIVTALADHPGDSLLAVQHPHRTPAALAAGRSLTDALPAARAMLDRLRGSAYRRVDNVVAPYRVDGPDGVAVGVLCLVDPAAVDPDGLPSIRHSEQVYPDVVAERAAALAGLGCATSAAMLVPVAAGARLTTLVSAVLAELGPAPVAVRDGGGRTHRLWLVGPGSRQAALLAAVQAGPLLVADGNHRVAAARGGLLALVTDGPELRIVSIWRGLVGTGLRRDDLADAWRRQGLRVTDVGSAEVAPGRVVVRTAGGALVVAVPAAGDEPVPRIEHGWVERVLIEEVLGIDPAGPLVRAVPAESGAEFVAGLARGEVDALIEIAAVPFADVLAVHEQGRRMPRKSTYFTPKPRSGLLLADLTG